MFPELSLLAQATSHKPQLLIQASKEPRQMIFRLWVLVKDPPLQKPAIGERRSNLLLASCLLSQRDQRMPGTMRTQRPSLPWVAVPVHLLLGRLLLPSRVGVRQERSTSSLWHQ